VVPHRSRSPQLAWCQGRRVRFYTAAGLVNELILAQNEHRLSKLMALALKHQLIVLTGPIADQAALRGLLSRLWDLNLTVIALRRIAPPDEPEGEAQ